MIARLLVVLLTAMNLNCLAQTPAQEPAIGSSPSVTKAVQDLKNDPQYQADRKRAFELYDQQRMMDVLPIVQRLNEQDPKDVAVTEMYGFVLYSSAAHQTNEAEAKATRVKARQLLLRAKEMGDNSDLLNTLLAKIPEDGTVGAFSTKQEVDAAMREGERLFTSGELEKAIASYQSALLLEPKLYAAPLFIGDCYFKLKKYSESSEWFAKAIAINPDQETAYRYWGDALMANNQMDEARHKFIEAYIVEPYGKPAGFALVKWAKANNVQAGHPRIQSPNAVKDDGPNKTTITLNAANLDAKDGSSAWMMYDMLKASWHGDRFKKEFPDEKTYRHSLREEAEGLSMVASQVEGQVKSKKVTKLDPSLATLVKLKNDGLIESFVLLAMADNGIAQDYYPYLKDHRDKLRKYVEDYVVPAGASSAAAAK